MKNPDLLILRAIKHAYDFKPEVIAAGIMLAHGVTIEEAHAALCGTKKVVFAVIDDAVRCSVFNAFDSAVKGQLTPNMTGNLFN